MIMVLNNYMDSDIPMYLQLPPYEPSILDHYRQSAVFRTDLGPKDYNAQLNYIPYGFKTFLYWLRCVVL